MFSSLFLIVITITLWYINYKWKRRRLYKLMKQFDGPAAYPIIGNTLEFFGPSREILLRAIKLLHKYGSPLRLWLMDTPYILISNPEDFQTIAHKTLEKDSKYRFIVDMLGDGIFTAEVKKWKRHRQILNPAFNPLILFDNFMEIFNHQNYLLIQALKKEVGTEKHFDLWPYLNVASVNTISETSLGREENFPEKALHQFGEAMIKSAEIISKRFYKPWLQIPIIFKLYKYFKGYENIFEIVHEYPLKILNAKRQRIKEKNLLQEKDTEKKCRNFIEILLDVYDKQVLSDQDLKNEVISIMFGGSETSALTISFLLLMLAIRQDIQDKLYAEVQEIFGDSDRPPTRQDLVKLVFMEQCIKETLRRFPVVPVIIRHASQDIPISQNYIVPAGANIALAIMGIHYNPNIYPDPFVWNPYNFDPDKVASRHKCSFVPFSTGPRGCIGEKYAWISMKAQLSTILRNYRFSTDTTMDDIVLDVDLVMRKISGYKVKLHYRKTDL